MYKAHTSDFEEQFCNAILEENEAMAMMMLKYLSEYLKLRRLGSMSNVYLFLDRLRSCMKFTINNFQRDIASFFTKPVFTIEALKDEVFMSRIVEGLHFELPIRLAKNPLVTVWPKSKHSVKVVAEVASLEALILLISKERRLDDSSEDIIKTFIDFSNLDLSQVRGVVDSESLAIFYDAQIKCLFYFTNLMKVRDQSPNVLNYFRQCNRQIADGYGCLLRKSTNTLPTIRKEILGWLKQMLTSDIRVELIEALPVLCYDEILIGSSALVSPQLRSELFLSKAELFYTARGLITWTTFQLYVFQINGFF